MNRAIAILIVICLWAAIYLPALGSLEIKGEEGRRILPAVTMLDTGNYLVPQIGSQPYLNKPPLINWLVAASFKLFGARNEWTARLPSALSVLVAALAFATIGAGSLGRNGSLVAAIAWLTNFGILEKGRLIEIEAVYVSLTALAFMGWFALFQARRSPWLTWTIPWLFLGLGWLAKGPLHLLFFYAVVIAVLFQRRELRRFCHPAHLIGLLLMSAIFAAWALPYLGALRGVNVGHSWTRQLSGRLSGEDFRFASWVMNIPRGLAYFLPWLLLFPIARRIEFVDETERRTVRGLAWGIVASFVAVSLLPGSLPRYTMPLLGPCSQLCAILLCAERLDLPRWLSLEQPRRLSPALRLATTTAALVLVVMLLYATLVVPQLQKRQKIKSIATQIDQLVRPGETLFAIDPDYQPFLFYLRGPIRYLASPVELPADAHVVLVQAANRAALERKTSAAPSLAIKDYRGKESTIYRLGLD